MFLHMITNSCNIYKQECQISPLFSLSKPCHYIEDQKVVFHQKQSLHLEKSLEGPRAALSTDRGSHVAPLNMSTDRTQHDFPKD